MMDIWKCLLHISQKKIVGLGCVSLYKIIIKGNFVLFNNRN